MNKKWKITGAILSILFIGGLWFIFTPVNLRPDLLGNKISEVDFAKGKKLLNEIADWYDDKLGMAGWDELAQQFEMTSTLGTDDSEFTLLNGINQGQIWGVQNWKSYQIKNGQKEFIDNEKYQNKLIYKNYWFQFPFRINEAPNIAYAGESRVNGEMYDLLYSTWGSEKPNRQFDQFVLYLDKETRMVE